MALRNTWSLRSLANCLTNELGIPISFNRLQRITKDLGVRCKDQNLNCYMQKIMKKENNE